MEKLIVIHGGEPGIPPGLMVSGQMQGKQLDDGRIVVLGLPPLVHNAFYPDMPLPPEEESENSATEEAQNADAAQTQQNESEEE